MFKERIGRKRYEPILAKSLRELRLEEDARGCGIEKERQKEKRSIVEIDQEIKGW